MNSSYRTITLTPRSLKIGLCKACGKEYFNMVRVPPKFPTKPFEKPRHVIKTWRDEIAESFCGEECYHAYNLKHRQNPSLPEDSKKHEEKNAVLPIDLHPVKTIQKGMNSPPLSVVRERHDAFYKRTKWIKKILEEEEGNISKESEKEKKQCKVETTPCPDKGETPTSSTNENNSKR